MGNPKIEKLDNYNYDVWSIQMKSVLIQSELWRIVDRKIVKSDENSDEWELKDEKALATLLLGVKPSLLRHIKNCETSSEAWDKLKVLFKEAGPVRKGTLYKKLNNMQMIEGDDVHAHIDEFMSIVDKLSESDKLPDDLVSTMILSSLSSDFENFTIAMETRDKHPAVNFIIEKIYEEVERRKQHKNSSEEDNVHVYAARNYNTKNKSGKRCYICGEMGHFAANCKKRGNNKLNKEYKSFAALGKLDTEVIKADMWCLDSGASAHMCCNKNYFVNYQPHIEQISLADNKCMFSEGIGEVKLNSKDGEIFLKNVLYVPQLRGNFISVTCATKKGFNVLFKYNIAVIHDKEGEVILKAHLKNNLFIIENLNNKCMNINTDNKIMKWHARYGHLNIKSLQDLVRKNMVIGLENVVFPDKIDCLKCLKSKIHVQSFPQASITRANNVLDLIHTDVCGPFRTPSLTGTKYFLTFTDDMSRRVYVYFMKTKDEVFEKFLNFMNMVERQTGRKIKTIRSDNGKEYINKKFDELFKNKGIKRQLSVPYTPQQNGVSERINRTLVEMARTLMLNTGIIENMWPEAIATAAYVRNRSPTKALNGITPYEAWTNKKPSVKHLRIFGSKAICLDKNEHNKMKPKGKEYTMVGYSLTSKAYRLFDSKNKKIIEARDVMFIEKDYENEYSINEEIHQPILKTKIKQFKQTDKKEREDNDDTSDNFFDLSCVPDSKKYYNNKNSTDINDNDNDDDKEEYYDIDTNNEEDFNENDNEEDSIENDNEEEFIENDTNTEEEYNEINTEEFNEQINEPINNEVSVVQLEEARYGRGRPKIIRTGNRGRPKKQRNVINVIELTSDVKVPKTVNEAYESAQSKDWKDAMQKEYDALIKNQTWTITELPEGHRAIGCKWVFALKHNGNGEIEKYKCRLVAKGCSQRYGIDFKETFSPVIRHASIRLLLALAVEQKLYVHHMDVCTAYLNSDLYDIVYMKQPEGFQDKNHPERVLKLNKAIYGLKQSGREWNTLLDSVLKEMDYIPCKNEPCLYKRTIDKNYSFIAVYVDDLLIACKTTEEMIQIKNKITNRFECVDKGPVNNYLGIQIERRDDVGSIKIHQSQYIKDLLKQYNMEKCRPASTPLDIGFEIKCNNETCKLVDATKYQSLVGELMYLALCTRPDIMLSVSKLAQRNSNPHIEHETGLKHILRYLASTSELKLHYEACGKPIIGFVDADWANNSIDRKSYSGYAFFLGGSVFAWEAKKQQCVALSSTEAEYIALTAAAKEAIFLRSLLKEILDINNNKEPLKLFGDNLSAQHLAKNPVYHARSKHIDIRHHFVRDIIKNGEIELHYIPTNEMIADILTKNLGKEKHTRFTKGLGLQETSVEEEC